MLCKTKTHKNKINTNKSTQSKMGTVWQNPIQRTVRTAHLSVLMSVHSFSTQYNTRSAAVSSWRLRTQLAWRLRVTSTSLVANTYYK